jgi:hypothetical protein
LGGEVTVELGCAAGAVDACFVPSPHPVATAIANAAAAPVMRLVTMRSRYVEN